MRILPAVDLIGGKVVRLFRGSYEEKTVYPLDAVEVACEFARLGARDVHIVDLDGAKSGKSENFAVIEKMIAESGLCAEVGGGIRNLETLEKYLHAGATRVILGTAAVTDPAFLQTALASHGESVAVGVDLKDGAVSIKGWTEDSGRDGLSFCRDMAQKGVRTLICTDISRDGAMRGTNVELYRRLKETLPQSVRLVASGGVSSLDDVRALASLDLYGAIIGKAYYTGDIDLKKAIETAR